MIRNSNSFMETTLVSVTILLFLFLTVACFEFNRFQSNHIETPKCPCDVCIGGY
jgi:hypothetical protein